jgi:hypothetical protein
MPKRYRDVTTAKSPFEDIPLPKKRRDLPYRGERALGTYGDRRTRAFGEPIRSRRAFEPYAVLDPNEARAVPKEVYPGTLLERIIYRRNLVLFGRPSPDTWIAQKEEFGGRAVIGGYSLDFVYFLSRPYLALEVQGQFWHDPFTRWYDEMRALTLRTLGYRYAEIWDEEILNSTDEELDQHLLDLVSGRILPYEEQFLTNLRPYIGLPRAVLTRGISRREI